MPDSIVTAYEESDVLDPRTDAVRPSVPPVMKPVDLGPVHVETPVVLSPMAGVTNWPFRVICESYGPDGLYVAEMITARALVARNPKALLLCHFAPSEKIRSLQLYGVNPAIVEQAAKRRENQTSVRGVSAIIEHLCHTQNMRSIEQLFEKEWRDGSCAEGSWR